MAFIHGQCSAQNEHYFLFFFNKQNFMVMVLNSYYEPQSYWNKLPLIVWGEGAEFVPCLCFTLPIDKQGQTVHKLQIATFVIYISLARLYIYFVYIKFKYFFMNYVCIYICISHQTAYTYNIYIYICYALKYSLFQTILRPKSSFLNINQKFLQK